MLGDNHALRPEGGHAYLAAFEGEAESAQLEEGLGLEGRGELPRRRGRRERIGVDGRGLRRAVGLRGWISPEGAGLERREWRRWGGAWEERWV